MGIPEEEEREKGTGSMLKAIMTENFPNLGREMDIWIHENQRIPNRLNLHGASLRYIIIVKSQRQRKDFKSSKIKERSYLQGNPNSTISRFLNRNFLGQ